MRTGGTSPPNMPAIIFARSITVTYGQTVSKGWIETGKEGGGKRGKLQSCISRRVETFRLSARESLFRTSFLAIYFTSATLLFTLLMTFGDSFIFSLTSTFATRSCERNERNLWKLYILLAHQKCVSRNILRGHLSFFIKAVLKFSHLKSFYIEIFTITWIFRC